MVPPALVVAGVRNASCLALAGTIVSSWTNLHPRHCRVHGLQTLQRRQNSQAWLCRSAPTSERQHV